jgi:hypothetical protein
VALAVDRTSARQGDDVVVTETVHNLSGDMSGSSTAASLALPAGVTVTSGGSTSWTPGGGTLAASATVSHQWIVHGTDDGLKQLSATARMSAYGETFNASASASVRVDSTPPSPSIQCSATAEAVGSFPVSWGASDASGVAKYDVLVSTDGGLFAPWLTGTSMTSAAFAGQPGHRYSFELSATDPLDNASGFATCGPVDIRIAPAPTNPPAGGGLQTGGPVLPAAAQLRISRMVRHGASAVVTGSLVRGATGSVSGTYSAPGIRAAQAHARAAHGRYQLIFHLTRELRRARHPVVRIAYSGDGQHAPQRLTRRVRR